MKTILIVGAAGAQGAAVSRHLSSTGLYRILAFTRSTTSAQALALAALPHVELVVNGAQTGYDLDAYLKAAQSADYVFVNTDGFALGEQAETFWGIRLFELAARAGVQHFVYSGLDYIGKLSGYDPDLYTGHYEGKARVQEWIHAQQDVMPWTILRSGPYLEMLSALLAPVPQDDGTATLAFQLPLHDGAIPVIHLGDFGKYVHWALTHAGASAGLDLGIATTHASGHQIAAAAARATGRPARYVDVPLAAWLAAAWKHLPRGPDTKIGFQSVRDDSALPTMTYGDNFAHWWHLYRATRADNTGLITRDYAQLDALVPDRLRSLDAWMAKVRYTGDKQAVLNLEAATS